MTRFSLSALIISDSAPLRRYAASSLGAADFFCVEAASGYDAADHIATRLFDVYVVDLDMPAAGGVSIFAISLYGRDPSPVVLGCSARPDRAHRGVWLPGSLVEVIGLPFAPDRLIAAGRAAMRLSANTANRKGEPAAPEPVKP